MEPPPTPSPAGPGTPPPEPPRATYALGTGLFLRALAVVHAIAFASAWVQVRGLIGPGGLMPAERFFPALREALGRAAWVQAPSLCWVFGAGAFLHVLCGVGLLLSVLLFAGVAPAPCLGLLWACYLSLATAGQDFFGFQWDALLLEATAVAVFMVPWRLGRGSLAVDPPRPARLLLLWLLFRLMFLSGLVKLTSGDPAWRSLTALDFHFATQPLPTPLAWYVHNWPPGIHRFLCAGLFAIELGCPWLLFLAGRPRRVAAFAFLALMAAIALTGNYAFFNLLTAALCLPCLDDGWFSLRLGWSAPGGDGPAPSRAGPGPFLKPAVLWGVAAGVFAWTSVDAASRIFPAVGEAPGVPAIREAVEPFRTLNTYGLFAVMTTERPELVFEGSDDLRTWEEYELPHKPGDPGRRPDWVAPYQPRLDWQLWFAALGGPERNPWVEELGGHLLLGNPRVLALFARNPFPDHPPRYMRVVRYDYTFTDPAARARSGRWWRRMPVDLYVPPFSLRRTDSP